MFPRSFLFFIFLIVLDLILKSIKDKQKIEKARSKRQEQLNRQPGSLESTISPPKKRRESIQTSRRVKEKPIIDKVIPLVDEKSTRVRRIEEEYLNFETFQQEIQSPIENKIKKKRTKKSKDQFKNDILKGIIYSEILSEPKSLRNKRKSI